MKSEVPGSDTPRADDLIASAEVDRLDFQNPEVVLSVLEADQVVAAKRKTRFGRRKLSWGTDMLLWGLRIYVIAMLVIVLLSVLQALRAPR